MKIKTLLVAALAVLAVLPLSARKVYVARHAQVGIGIKEISETRITEDLGVTQAKKLADYLVKKLKFNGTIYASPFYRTTETATYTAALLNKKIILEPGLQEMAPYKKPAPKGMTLKQIKSYFGDKVVPGNRYKDGWRLCRETLEMRRVRVAKALDAMLAETKGDLLLVTHGACVIDLNKIMTARVAGKKRKLKGTGWNCALYVYELNDKNEVTGYRYTTEFMDDSEVTSNFRCPKIERPDDKRYMTRAQDAADRAKRNAKLKAKEKAAGKKK
ncbi:MAG: histidine phosphatase family protein [Lentisphaerae bacterium]|nr:histidine phosphatase family protein [Lentisphaerota bacterium]